MKKKLEDKLAMLAFGDVDPRETARIEHELGGNDRARAILAEYREMRAALKALGEIPEHQLSTQRLRHAVLNSGLKPKPRPQFGWIWMPAAAFALAFGVFMIRSMNRAVPLVNASGARNDAGFATNFPIERPGSDFSSATASAQILSVGRPTPPVTLASNRHASQRRASNALVESLRRQVDEEFAKSMAMESPMADNIRLQPAHGTPVSDGSPIVMIGNTKDASTGAQKATEVDSADNVIVGG